MASRTSSSPNFQVVSDTVVEIVLLAIALIIGGVGAFYSPLGAVLAFGLIVAATAGSGALRHLPRRWTPISAVPVITALLLVTVTEPATFNTLVLGLGDGVVALCWIGLPLSHLPPVSGSEIGRELVIPLAGGAVALSAAAIPIVGLVRAAALVIGVFAALALLIIFLAELLPAPPAETPRQTPPLERPSPPAD